MRCGVIGDGRMGRAVCREIEAVVGMELEFCLGKGRLQQLRRLGRCDCLFDFSHPRSLEAIREYIERTGAALVCGTTGFSPAQLAETRALGERAPVVISSNFSPAMAVMRQLPAAMAVTFPPLSTVATAVSLLRQTTPVS